MSNEVPLVHNVFEEHHDAFHSLEGRSLSYRPSKGPYILKDVSTGLLEERCLCAVMGASGSGKTTLLKVLSGRLRETCGDVLVNGEPRQAAFGSQDRRWWKQIASFIPQEDVLPRSLTPRQVLQFQARLHGFQGSEAKEATESVLERLKLTRCADTMIGDGHTLQGLSGGERKRCSVGLELLTRPRVLLLDECTSGLDGPMALELITMLRSLCKDDAREDETTGILAVCTIHQPSSKVFALFDYLILLKLGEVIYAGPGEKAGRYFESINSAFKIPLQTNPAEHYLDLLQGDMPPPAMRFEALQTSCLRIVDEPSQPSRSNARSGYKTSMNKQFRLLVLRTLLMRVTDPAQCRVRVCLTAVVAGILGLTYWQLEDTQGTVTDRQSAMFGSLVFLAMNTMVTTAIIFPLEKAFVFREYHNGSYHLLAWYFANMFASLVLQLMYSTVYIVLFYYMIGLRPGLEHFLVYLAVGYTMGSIGVVLGTLLGIALPAVHMVTAVVPPLIMPQLIFSGFMIRPGAIPVYFKWLYHISFFQYSFQIIMVDQFHNFTFAPCNPGDFCPLGLGEQSGDIWIKEMFGYDTGSKAITQCWLILAAMLIVLFVLGYWVTKVKARGG